MEKQDSLLAFMLAPSDSKRVVAIAGNKTRINLFTRRFAYVIGAWLAYEGVSLRACPCRGFTSWLLQGWHAVDNPEKELDLYLAFRKQNGYTTSVYTKRATSETAALLFPPFKRLSGVEKQLASTHVELVLGRDLDDAVDALIYFTQDRALSHADVDKKTGVGGLALVTASHCREAGLPLSSFTIKDWDLQKDVLTFLTKCGNRMIANLASELLQRRIKNSKHLPGHPPKARAKPTTKHTREYSNG